MEAPQRKRIGSQTVAFLEHTGPYADIGGVYHRLYAWAKKAKAKAAGPAFTIFLQSPDKLDWRSGRFEVCLPVPKGTTGSGDVRVKGLPATDVLAVVVSGPYRDMPAHYSEFLAWMSVEGTAPAGPPREIYLVHPGPDGSGDPKTFRTEVQFPISS
jgi:effector-binding domain-containing protein